MKSRGTDTAELHWDGWWSIIRFSDGALGDVSGVGALSILFRELQLVWTDHLAKLLVLAGEVVRGATGGVVTISLSIASVGGDRVGSFAVLTDFDIALVVAQSGLLSVEESIGTSLNKRAATHALNKVLRAVWKSIESVVATVARECHSDWCSIDWSWSGCGVVDVWVLVWDVSVLWWLWLFGGWSCSWSWLVLWACFNVLLVVAFIVLNVVVQSSWTVHRECLEIVACEEVCLAWFSIVSISQALTISSVLWWLSCGVRDCCR